MYVGTLGNLGKVPASVWAKVHADKFRPMFEEVLRLTYPVQVFTPERITYIRNAMISTTTPQFRVRADLVRFRDVVLEVTRRLANFVRETNDPAEQERRWQIYRMWNPPDESLKAFAIAVGGILTAGALSVLLAPAGAAPGVVASGGTASATAAATAATTAATTAVSTIPVLEGILVTATRITAAQALATSAAAAAGGIAVAATLPPVPAVPPVHAFPDIQIIGTRPLTFPTEILAPALAPVPFSQSLPAFEMPAQPTQPRDFGLPESAPQTLTDRLVDLAKDYAIQYGKDAAIAYVQEEMQRKLLAAEEARLRAEMDAMERELRSLAPGAASGSVQAGTDNDKIAALLALLTAWAFRG